jgi:hypothetical protein
MSLSSADCCLAAVLQRGTQRHFASPLQTSPFWQLPKFATLVSLFPILFPALVLLMVVSNAFLSYVAHRGFSPTLELPVALHESV